MNLPTTATIIIVAIVLAVMLYMLYRVSKTGSNVVPFVVVSFVLMVSTGLAMYVLASQHQAPDEISMGVMVVAAIATLLTVLFTLTAGFSAMGLADSKQPLGLPEGSIRAMIALVLIMVFILFGVHLFRNVGQETSVWLGNFHALPDSSNVKPPAHFVVVWQASDSSFNVWLSTPPSDEAKRLAQQLITTVGTLVVAVAGFYFGSSVTSSALSSAAAKSPPAGDLSVTDTAGAVERLKSWEPPQPPLP